MTTTVSSLLTAQRDARVVANALKIRYTPFVAAGGEGTRLFDESGRAYLDFGAAWSLAGLGYSNERVRAAIIDELGRSTWPSG
jgi:4-aminobutyrate aminotransferase-like enzyme